MMTQKDNDWMDKMLDVLKLGTILEIHPRDTNERYWASGPGFGLWLYPGEVLMEHDGKGYVLGMRDA